MRWKPDTQNKLGMNRRSIAVRHIRSPAATATEVYIHGLGTCARRCANLNLITMGGRSCVYRRRQVLELPGGRRCPQSSRYCSGARHMRFWRCCEAGKSWKTAAPSAGKCASLCPFGAITMVIDMGKVPELLALRGAMPAQIIFNNKIRPESKDQSAKVRWLYAAARRHAVRCNPEIKMTHG